MEMLSYAKEIFDIEIEELKKIKEKLSDSIVNVAYAIKTLEGKVVITGIGKSGLIGKKIAATLASTGTLSVFMNSAEGLHGDLGMINSKDIVIAISNSGNSDEVLSIMPSIKKIGAKVVAMTGNPNSPLAKSADYILDIGVEREGCPLNLAPMSSTTATLVMGDALAALLIKLKDFKPENFAVYHPGGSLGRRLLMRVKDVMHKEDLPICSLNDDMDRVVLTMTNKRLGAVAVVEEEKMRGLITEGDIRRALKRKEEFFELRAKDIMTEKFISINEEIMAIDALEVMENRESQISVLPVIKDESLRGIVRIHDLLRVVG